jgi:hypothetical protein
MVWLQPRVNSKSECRWCFAFDWFGAARAHPAADLAKSCLIIGTATLSDLPRALADPLLALRPPLHESHLARSLEHTGLTAAEVRLWMRPLAASVLQAGAERGHRGRDWDLVTAIATGRCTLV